MTQFDLGVLALLAISGAVGFARGAAREIAALAALVVAAAVAIFTLAPASHFARRMVHPDWLAAAAALIVVFLVAYIVMRMIGLAIARQIHDAGFLGALDRSAGTASDHLAPRTEHGPSLAGPDAQGARYRRPAETGVRSGGSQRRP